MNIYFPEWNDPSAAGNDFSTLFAPLIRDGRMDKFYWDPEFEEKVAMVFQLYRDDNISVDVIERLIERFKNQPLDFFGALRSSMYDSQILYAPHRFLI